MIQNTFTIAEYEVHKIKTYEEDLEHFVIQEHTNKSLKEFG
jgi:hypothetical protein